MLCCSKLTEGIMYHKPHTMMGVGSITSYYLDRSHLDFTQAKPLPHPDHPNDGLLYTRCRIRNLTQMREWLAYLKSVHLSAMDAIDPEARADKAKFAERAQQATIADAFLGFVHMRGVEEGGGHAIAYGESHLDDYIYVPVAGGWTTEFSFGNGMAMAFDAIIGTHKGATTFVEEYNYLPPPSKDGPMEFPVSFNNIAPNHYNGREVVPFWSFVGSAINLQGVPESLWIRDGGDEPVTIGELGRQDAGEFDAERSPASGHFGPEVKEEGTESDEGDVNKEEEDIEQSEYFRVVEKITSTSK